MTNTTFLPSGLGDTIFRERYAHSGEEWNDACMRLATAVAAAEENGKVEQYRTRYFDQLSQGLFMPGGRYWYGAGRPIQQLSNCYVIPCEDTIQGWGKVMSDVAVISSKGGGVGINFSPVRPRGYPIGGMGGTATGAVSLMRIIDAIGEEIKDGGGRRAALMFCLDINHPDILEFLDAKLKVGEISNANISVVIPKDYDINDFIDAVQNDGDIELRFHGLPDREGRSVKAKEIWTRLVENSWQNGEPGVLNFYYAGKMGNLEYCRPVVSVNPCGEQVLGPYSNCNLGALVLSRFVKDGRFDWDLLDESIRLGVRFLDAAIDVTDFPLTENTQAAADERRVGLGVMGLHSMLLDLGMKYASDEAYEFADKLFATIKNTAYDASINLAIEKGPFPLYRPEYLQSGFVKSLKRGIKAKIKEHGIRNSHLLTIAPTGTTSLVQGVTGGIEPVFSPVYVRRRRVVDSNQREEIAETLVVSQEYSDHPDLVEGAYDICPRDHLRMQAVAQKHIDAAVSKCVAEGTLIPTDKGLIPIENMGSANEGEFGTVADQYQVISHDGVQHAVTGFYANGVVDTIRMRTDTGAILEGSHKHRVLTVDGWKAMPDLRIGDGVIGRFAAQHGSGGEPINFDYQVKTNAKIVSFPERMTLDFAKWLGMMCADGHTAEPTGNVGLTAKSRCGTPEAEYDRLSEMFESPMRNSVDKRNGTLTKSMTSRNFTRYVESLIGKGAKDKHVPEQILRGSADEKLQFLNGMTLDGYLTDRKALMVYAGISEDLADGIEALCRSFGLPSVWRWTECKADGYLVHKVSVCAAMQSLLDPVERHKHAAPYDADWLVPIPVEVLHMKLPCSDPRYSTLRSIKSRGMKWCKRRTLERLGVQFDLNVYVTKVTSLEASAAMTYDIEVEGAHSYVVNGLVSHNTCNMPKDYPMDDLSDLWLEFLPGLKGTTFYREGSRESAESFEPMKHVPANLMNDMVLEWELDGKDVEHESGSMIDDCASGACSL